jgi:hypothetical protein
MSLGFICFRANTMSEAVSMWITAFSPSAYGHFAMPRSFYPLTSIIVVGYFAFEAGHSLLLSSRLRYRQALGEGTLATNGLWPPTNFSLMMGAFFDFFAARLWWWFAPAVLILMVFAGLAMYKQSAVIAVTPFIYTLF